ncbi:hypothetical protein KTQ74_11355 [Pseudomonas chlororaphis]|uniref:hypothetical protein n=1 Tax=Pseudomonas chlororaphis TaxID=587753 RepID=UPI001E45023C|nr:hypothetical protein [Pseudomonas chlororaphis]MCB2252494.1 hypothetical protein [Pseudomonas chlororaphis]
MDDVDPVHCSHGGQSVGDGYAGFPTGGYGQVPMDGVFNIRIQSRGCFIEYENF